MKHISIRENNVNKEDVPNIGTILNMGLLDYDHFKYRLTNALEHYYDAEVILPFFEEEYEAIFNNEAWAVLCIKVDGSIKPICLEETILF